MIEEGKIDTTPLITHSFPLSRVNDAYRLFENKDDGASRWQLQADQELMCEFKHVSLRDESSAEIT